MEVASSSSEYSSYKSSESRFSRFRSSPSTLSSSSLASIIALSAVDNSLFLFFGQYYLMCPFLLHRKHDISFFRSSGSTSPSSPHYMKATYSLSDMRFTPFLMYSNFSLYLFRRWTARSALVKYLYVPFCSPNYPWAACNSGHSPRPGIWLPSCSLLRLPWPLQHVQD